ncbi:ABC transporter ATP-binding protein [Paramaledivibacter caminithermalis]|jgi:iron complex transport system ATP-binding protein|uniref:Iron complex transport system ATP-binding protein n=1 Tax=Paramaledivibacter caminithermalis (strain DSM 15212 / CIP 107654 / DViRD3) TaxID=1121301 RepID=A0A1M6KV46_PARC5|nr:ABC transporter ATP-binding protein [Paramaledivibacter caminithermalis]SHJ62732.1 iron complex transport system ATP-binding protein [Paramaledivibacter caminithermalis DSM 15212]
MFIIENLDFSYGSKKILNDINLKIKKGIFMSIIGPNGSGKTTLINLINGMNTNYSGNIRYLDKDLFEYSIEEKAKNFSIISQRSAIDFPFTCMEIVMMGRNPYKNRLNSLSEKDLGIVIDVMKKTDTFKFANSLITEVSGGELQRIILARALAQNPRVLFLDEAFSAMDISYKINAIRLIKKLVKEEGLTVVSVMHDINVAYKFSDEVCALKQGKVQGFGNPKEIITESFVYDVFDVEVEKINDKGFFVKV